MLKILEIIPSLASASGGAEILFVDLCAEMAKNKDVSVEIVCLYDGVNERYKNKLANLGIKVHELSKKIGVDFKCSSKLKRLVSDIKPDIVHLHLGVILTYFLAFKFKKQHYRTFLTVHTLANLDDNKVSLYLRKLYSKKKLINFIGISDSISSSIREYYKSENVVTVNNGFDISYSAKSKVPFDKKKYDFICVAVFKEAKNHKLLFDGFQRILKSFPNVKLICVGGGHLFEKYKSYLVSSGIDNVYLAGQQNDVYSFLENSKFFILTSFYEGNPISVLEAMNAGLPIIAPKVGGIPDVVEEGVNGFLFKSCDLDDLESKMTFVIEQINGTKYEAISVSNRAKASKFSIKNTSDEYLKVFKE